MNFDFLTLNAILTSSVKICCWFIFLNSQAFNAQGIHILRKILNENKLNYVENTPRGAVSLGVTW